MIPPSFFSPAFLFSFLFLHHAMLDARTLESFLVGCLLRSFFCCFFFHMLFFHPCAISFSLLGSAALSFASNV
ncbi:hypothetical protein M407DRAFT_94473 [Tulasnella calospora MUT 4182]|uniref:Uncharacterized protein n=1 Tax=Tulasnella calospora MUT 4182 TaxID=1051891 RepID=A0A0C3LUH4_9AGAM|nr:hypothetical protein M407DRAFT_94473 [Tulasnella calospora MUT 4182]